MDNDRPDYDELVEFAKGIIVRAPKFREFAVAMMDYAGRVTGDVFLIYDKLHYIGLPADVELDDPKVFWRYTSDDLKQWYEAFQKQQKEKYEEDKKKVKDGIDELQYLNAVWTS